MDLYHAHFGNGHSAHFGSASAAPAEADAGKNFGAVNTLVQKKSLPLENLKRNEALKRIVGLVFTS